MDQSKILNPNFSLNKHHKFISDVWNSLHDTEKQWYYTQDIHFKNDISNLKISLKTPVKFTGNIQHLLNLTEHYTELWNTFIWLDIPSIVIVAYIMDKAQVLKHHNIFCDIIHLGITSNIIKTISDIIIKVKIINIKKCLILALINFLDFPIVRKMKSKYKEFKLLVDRKMKAWYSFDDEFVKSINNIIN